MVRSFLLASPACCFFPSPPPFHLTDEDAVSTVLDTHDVQREKEKRQQRETMNMDAQVVVLGLLSMGSAHISIRTSTRINTRINTSIITTTCIVPIQGPGLQLPCLQP